MSEIDQNKSPELNVPKWFLIVCILAVLWDAMGLMAFISDALLLSNPDAIAKIEDEKIRTLYETQPMWPTIAFAIATIGGFLGSILLLMKKKLAIPVLVASLLGVLAQSCYGFFMSNTIEVMGAGAAIFSAIIISIAMGLVGLAFYANSKGWLS